jgi:hypothetical protein
MNRCGKMCAVLLVGLAMTLTGIGCSEDSTDASKVYSLVGQWTFAETFGNQTQSMTYTFTGTANAGTFTSPGGGWSGTYTVSGSTFTMLMNNVFSYAGTFEGETTVKGTISRDGSQRGTFLGSKN